MEDQSPVPSNAGASRKSKKLAALPSSSSPKTGTPSTDSSSKLPLVQLTYGEVKKPMFRTAMGKISGHPFKDQKIAYRVMRIVDSVEIELKGAERLHAKLVDQFAEKDEKGEFVPLEGRPGTFRVPPDRQEEYGKALTDFDALSFAMRWRKLSMDDLSDLRLSAAELKAVESIVHFPDD